ncbi:MAG: response regulator [Nitrospinae bacterium]|nr:response regulator [Nitrospinota bacterium]
METLSFNPNLGQVEIRSTRRRPKKILIVDQEDTLTWSLSRGLFRDQQRCQTLVAHEVEEALQLLERDQIDLVVVEIELPDLHGLDFLAQVAHASPRTKVIFMASYGHRDLEDVARKKGARGWITKPFEISSLREAITHSLEA